MPATPCRVRPLVELGADTPRPRVALALAALTAALGISLAPLPARAADEAEVELSAGAFIGPGLGVGMLGVGVSGVYMPAPHYGIGGALAAFYVDNGADPYYSEDGTLDRGHHGVVFAEGDLLTGWVTPYARLALGAGRYSRFYDAATRTETNLTLAAAAGVALRGGPVVLRLSAAPSSLGGDFVVVYGAEVGGRF